MTKICPSCKAQIRDDEAQFCMKCGSVLNAGSNPQGGDFFSDAAMNEPQGSGDFFKEAESVQNTYSVEDAANAGNMDAIQEMMMTYFNQGDYRDAQKWAKKGAASNDALCMHILGEIAMLSHNYQEAVRWFQRNVQINSFGLSASELGIILLNTDDDPAKPKDIFRAKGLFELALQEDPEYGDAWAGLGVAYLASDEDADMSKAKQCLQKACELGSPETKKGAQELLGMIAQKEQENANSGGCFITTAVCDSFGKPDDCYELMAFRDFRDSWLRRQEDGETLVSEYYATAPRIVSAIECLSNAKEIYRAIWNNYLSPCLCHIEKKEFTQCKALYMQMVCDLKAQFLS